LSLNVDVNETNPTRCYITATSATYIVYVH